MIPIVHVDPAYVTVLREEFGELAVQLVDLLETTAAHGLAELDAAIAAGDDAELRRVAHRLKGGFQSLGATTPATACLELETGAPDPAGAVADLRAALPPSLEELRALVTLA